MNFEIITTTQRLETICDHARTHSVVMLDTEFVRTRTLYPKLGLIQMFDSDNLVLIDPIEIGDLTPTRDFNYVEDTCRGFIALAECEAAIGQTVNIGSNYEISIGDTLNLIKKLMNSDIKFITSDERYRPSKSEVLRLWCDNSKIEKLTQFKPEVDIEDGLKKTISWFENPDNLKKYKSGIYNV